MRVLRIDEHSPFRQLVGVGGLGTGMFFALEGDHTLGRNESRLGSLLDVRDYCKLHIVSHYVAKLLGADRGQFAVVPLGTVGDDAAGAFVLREMRSAGIDTRFVKVVSGRPTLFSICFQYPDGSGGNITTANSAAAALSAEEVNHAWGVVEPHARQTIALLVPEIPLAMRRHFLHLAKQKGAFCVASFVSGEIAEARLVGMFDHLHLVSLNEEEAAQFAGEAQASDSVESLVGVVHSVLQSRYPQLKVIMSAGKHGAYFVDRAGWSHSAAPEVEVASTAGAGDCLLGGILAALAAGIPLPDTQAQSTQRKLLANALDFGVLLASYKVSSPHTIHPDAALDEVLRFARERGMSVASAVEQFVGEGETVKAGS